MNPITVTTSGLEYRIIPPGSLNYVEGTIEGPSDFAWSSVSLDIENGRRVLNGYRIEVRYYVRRTTTTYPPVGTEGDPTVTVTYTYPPFVVNSMTLTKSSPERQVFVTDLGTELFAAEPGTYFEFEPAVAGITDGTEYSYFRVFDQAEVSWLPRCSTVSDEMVDDQPLPVDPHEEDDRFPKYPMDALTSFFPDPRELVVVSYTLETNYTTQMFPGIPGDLNNPDLPAITTSESVVITQDCTQDVDANFADKLLAALDMCYFTNKYYHVSLYENEHPRVYNDEGEPIGEVREPEYDGVTLVNSVYDYGIRTVTGPFLPIEEDTPDD